MTSGPDPDILDQIRVIIRRDLKLPADASLPDDMPFFGGDVDLDSLDMLLLVTSIERHFGVKVANEAIGKEAFQNVASLARFVQRAQQSDWLSRLPHGEPFRFITRVNEVRPGEIARGVWALTGSEPFFAGHFPGRPIVPGVLIAEALAQLSGLAGPPEAGSAGKLAHIDIRFVQSIAPPIEIQLTSTAVRTLGALQMFDVIAEVGPTILARGSITLHRSEKAPDAVAG